MQVQLHFYYSLLPLSASVTYGWSPYVCSYARMHKHKHTHMHTLTHACTYMCAHMHTHTPCLMRSLLQIQSFNAFCRPPWCRTVNSQDHISKIKKFLKKLKRKLMLHTSVHLLSSLTLLCSLCHLLHQLIC